MEEKNYKILEIDPYLEPYKADINLRMERFNSALEKIERRGSLLEYASAYEYYGFHIGGGKTVYREDAPAAKALFLVGDFNGWNTRSHPLRKNDKNDWEIVLDFELPHLSLVKVVVLSERGEEFRIPLYITRVHRNERYEMCGQIWNPKKPYKFKVKHFELKGAPIIYECHIGMAGEKEGVSTFNEFRENVLSSVVDGGYNVLQIMAVMEHPYYASFGYQVSNFFAVCSLFGTPDDLKALIDEAHKRGVAVLLDIVHSHAVKNTEEGINGFDGTQEQFFMKGSQGFHPAWGSMCFDYGKDNVKRFLLSNVRFFMEEYKFDGYRFDGVTSMLYTHNGLGVAFDSYAKYFSLATNIDAVNYLQLATTVMKETNPHSLAIAEDMSGMPGMCLPVADGGIGFDYRLMMGTPDMWTRLITNVRDEDWNMNNIYYELSSRRQKEAAIGYAESHDQALVGDKTIIFRLADSEMYYHMQKGDQNLAVDRAIALYKLIYGITMTLGGEGNLTFMGNEFGHPEWIDFPREGNGWSYKYARRQWHLRDDKTLKYSYLYEFNKALIALAKKAGVFTSRDKQINVDEARKIIAFEKNGYLFVFNFHPTYSEPDLFLQTNDRCGYELVFSGDEARFGGFNRVSVGEKHDSTSRGGKDGIEIYSPNRSMLVFKRLKAR